jgi:tight adherence protein C
MAYAKYKNFTGKDIEEEETGAGLSSQVSMFQKNPLFKLFANYAAELIVEMQKLLQDAGIRHKSALEDFTKSKFISAIALFFISFLLINTTNVAVDLPFTVGLIFSLTFGVVGGHKLTDLNLEMIARKRQEMIERGVTDLIDLLIICTESGLDLSKSIRKISRELRTSNSVLAEELSLTAIELEMIPDYKHVFENLENRTSCLAIKTLSKTLCQSIEYGSSLTTSLRDLANDSRKVRMSRAESKAAQAPTMLTLPMMLFTMPCLFIVMLGPIIADMIKSFGSK